MSIFDIKTFKKKRENTKYTAEFIHWAEVSLKPWKV